jgi:hypothetical protein
MVLSFLFRRRRVILACADPAALERALAVLDGRDVRVAPTTDVLDRELRAGPALIVADGSLREGRVPLGALAPQLAEAVPLKALLADPRSVLRKGRPSRVGALPPGVFGLTAAVGRVGVTAAALGLARRLAAGGPTVLLELPGRRRASALLGRFPEEARDASEYLLAGGDLLPEPRERGALLLAVPGPAAARALKAGPALPAAFVAALARRFRYVVVDLGPDLPPEAAPVGAGFVLADPRPEAVQGARALAAAYPAYEPVLVARELEGVGAGVGLRLRPPPSPDRWGEVLVRRLLLRRW